MLMNKKTEKFFWSIEILYIEFFFSGKKKINGIAILRTIGFSFTHYFRKMSVLIVSSSIFNNFKSNICHAPLLF